MRHVFPVATTPRKSASPALDVRLVCYRGDALWLVVLGADSAGVAGHRRLSLEVELLAALLGLTLLGSILLDAVDELVSGSGVADVLGADVDALLDVAVADLAVEDDADGGLGHVVDDTGLAVVDLVWLCILLVLLPSHLLPLHSSAKVSI